MQVQIFETLFIIISLLLIIQISIYESYFLHKYWHYVKNIELGYDKFYITNGMY